jgi:transglutaminase-like putative cysteine protease
MANTDRRFAVPSEFGVAALVVAASLPLGRLFRTGSVFTTTFAAAVVSAAVAWALRRLRMPTVVAAVLSVAAFLWFASAQFFRDAMIGPFPTPDSVAGVWNLVVEAVRRSQVDAAPVAASASFLCLCSFAVWATAWLADDAAIKLRHPMLAIGVTVPLYVLPGTIVEGSNRWADAGLYLAAALWVLFQDERFRLSRWGRVIGTGVPGWRPGLAARMGMVAIALALVATPVLPGFGAPPGLSGVSGGGDRSVPNPLVSIRSRLGDRRNLEVFSVRTRSLGYMRLAALDVFNGTQWNSSGMTPSVRVSGRSVTPQTTAPTVQVQQDVEILSLDGPWLPAQFEPVRVDRLGGVAADPATRSLIAPTDLKRGLKYRVVSRVPQMTYEALDQVPFATDPSLRRYVDLPAGPETEAVTAIARDVIRRAQADTAGPFRIAVALQNYLRTFTYNENVALTHDIVNIVQFLQQTREGYCEQFATSMAVMARALGLPARVAIGFAGGSPGATPDQIVVTSRNAHAWVEIFLPGYGWVQFEPTPRADSVVVPSYTSRIQFAEPTAAPTAEPSRVAEPTPTASSTGREGIDPEIASRSTGAVGKSLVVLGVVLGGLLLLAAFAFPIAAGVRRAARLRSARSPHDRVAVRYLDFLDWCAATGNGRSPGETPLEHARRLAGASSGGRGAARELAALAVDAVYGPVEGPDPARASELGRRARTDLASTLARRRRIGVRMGWGWWRVDPASRGRLTGPPAEKVRPI